jgi:hypothetical protein
MALFVHGSNVSIAWLAGLDALLGTPNGDAVNLTVAIDDPDGGGRQHSPCAR